MTDGWLDKNVYDIVVDLQFCSEAVKALVRDAPVVVLPTADPFCKI
jgi:aminopeptidase C